ncbi:hypothetical protein ACFYU9_12330 [Streptomyces sp. NPDC004327]|uniref:hypothetical protein n=1 Tax=Streptomyces sp. NPDC004327 TaxID=3364699 RepID=UPI0036CD9294
MLAVACTSGSEAKVEVRDSATVQADTEKASSRVLEMLGLKGKATEAGAQIAPCSGYAEDERVYRAHHPWSVYGVPFADMQKAMDRLRGELPRNGWRITKDGVDGSIAKSPQIVAESSGREFAVDVRLQKASPNESNPRDFIEVTTESACFKKK